MDLLSTIHKSGSRGGVNFSWDEVATSQHRENYLGHSLKAPVGRWQKGRDLNWYAKADAGDAVDGETADEKHARERREEIKRIKEAEEDALARALGLPVAVRDHGQGTGANGISVGEVNKVVKETEEGDEEINEVGKTGGFGSYVGKIEGDLDTTIKTEEQGEADTEIEKARTRTGAWREESIGVENEVPTEQENIDIGPGVEKNIEKGQGAERIDVTGIRITMTRSGGGGVEALQLRTEDMGTEAGAEASTGTNQDEAVKITGETMRDHRVETRSTEGTGDWNHDLNPEEVTRLSKGQVEWNHLGQVTTTYAYRIDCISGRRRKSSNVESPLLGVA